MLYSNLTVNSFGHLEIAGYDAKSLAREYGTPAIFLDEQRIRARARAYRQALAELFAPNSFPLYASKAFSCKAIYKIIAEEGLGTDVVSSGELYTALAADFPAEKIYFHGSNKTDADIKYGIENRIGYFICDNFEELAVIEAEAEKAGIKQKILLRLTPGIDPHTHTKISTGKIDSKFGVAIETGQAAALTAHALNLKHVDLRGFHCHIGSQIFDATPFCDAATQMIDFIAKVKADYGFETEILNLGGGMAVPYTAADASIDYREILTLVANIVHESCQKFALTEPAVLIEPGRSIIADSGVTLYTVGTVKKIPGYKQYISVDGGMTDNPRFVLYEAKYTVLPATKMNQHQLDEKYTIAGRCCESGDLIQEEVPLPEMTRGDLLAVLTTGAYNYSMASNYNRIPKPPVVLLGKEDSRLIVRGENLADICAYDL